MQKHNSSPCCYRIGAGFGVVIFDTKTFILGRMDSITHITVGACLGEAFAGRQLGKKAMLWGALVHSLPDIDFLAGLWMDIPSELLAHRGFTHSFLFLFLVTPLLGWLAKRIHAAEQLSLQRWCLFFFTAILAHLFLDAFNNYGIGWFEPFSHHRISFHTLYVADPFFSLWPGVAFLALLRLQAFDVRRSFWWKFAFIMCGLYLAYCGVHKLQIDREVKQAFARQNIPHQRYFTTPAPLQNWLWFIVAGNDSGYYTGFRSLYVKKGRPIHFEYFPRRDSLLSHVQDHEALKKLIRFSQHFYTVELWGDTLVFNDLRFGQMIGWQSPRQRFVFHYYLSHPSENKLVVQRGRFAGWNLEVFWALLRRIVGLE